MFQINEKSLADNRTLITVQNSKSDINKSNKNGTIHYTSEDEKLWVTTPRVRQAYIDKNPLVNDQFSSIVTTDNDLIIHGDYSFQNDILFRSNVTINKNLLIKGDLNITGNKTVIDTVELTINDNTIELNRNETGAGVSLKRAGIAINRGTEEFSRWMFDEESKSFSFDLSETIDGDIADGWMARVYAKSIGGKLAGEFEAKTGLISPVAKISNTLNVGGLSTLNTISASGVANLNGALNVNGITSLKSATTVAGTLTASGLLNVSGNATFSNNVLIKKAATIEGTSLLKGSVTANNKVNITAGGLAVTGSTILNGTLETKEKATFKKDVQIDGNLNIPNVTITNNLTVKNINASGTVTTAGKTTLNGALEVNAASEFNSNVVINNGTVTANGKIIANAGADINNSNVNITNGNLNVDGDISATGNTSVTGTLNISGDATFTSDVDINNNLKANAIVSESNVSTMAGDGNGLKFWDNDKYKIYMASTVHEMLGGSMHGAGSSDYNMYFSMEDGTNRGFAFKNALNILMQVQSNGTMLVKDNIFSKGFRVLTQADEGHSKGLDADTVDGIHKTDILLRDGSQHMTGSLNMNKEKIHFTANDYIDFSESSSMFGKISTGVYHFKAEGEDYKSHIKAGGVILGSLQLQGVDGINSIGGIKRLEGLNGKLLLSADEDASWLRINSDSDYTNGVYLGTSTIRTDGEIQVGASGSIFKANSSSLTYKNKDILTTAGNDNMLGDINMRDKNLIFNSGKISSSSSALNVSTIDKNITIKPHGVDSIIVSNTRTTFAHNPYFANSRLLHVGDEGHGKHLDADTVDGAHKSDIVLRDGSQAMTGDLNLGAYKIIFGNNDYISFTDEEAGNPGVVSFDGINYNGRFNFRADESPNSVLSAGAIDLQGLKIHGNNTSKISGLKELRSDVGTVFKSEGSILKINSDNSHTGGIYLGTSKLNTGGAIEIGTNGAILNISNTILAYKGKGILTQMGTNIMYGDINFKDKKAVFGDGEISALASKLIFKNKTSNGTISTVIGSKEIILADSSKVKFTDNPYYGVNRILHTGDEGHSKGLDADTLDGNHFSDIQTGFTKKDGDVMTGKLTIETDNNQFNAKKGNNLLVVTTSSQDGDYLFGGKNADDNSDLIKDYVRIGNNKLKYNTSTGDHNIFHEGHKPTWSEVESKPSSFNPAVHNHDALYVSESDVAKRFKDMRDVVNHIESQLDSVLKTKITTSNWAKSLKAGYFEYTLVHNLGIDLEYLDVNFYNSDNSAVMLSFDYIDKNSIKLYSDVSEAVTAVVSGLSLTNDNSGLKEVKEARVNYFGKEFNTLKERLDDDYEKQMSNFKGKFIEEAFVKNLTVNNSIDGSTRGLKITGRTVGGYNSETSQSAPIVSTGMSENGVVKVKSCGKNLWDGTLEIGAYDATNGNELNNNPDVARSKNKTRLSKGTYTFSNSKNIPIRIFYYNINGVFTHSTTTNNSNTITIANDLYINFHIARLTSEDVSSIKIMLELGDIATDYEPYEESTLEIPLPDSMKSTGLQENDFVRAGANGFVEIVEYSTKYIVTGLEDVRYRTSSAGNNYYTVPINILTTTNTVICDKLQSETDITVDNNIYSITGYLTIVKEDITTLEDMKIWLISQNLNVVIKRSSPIIHTTTIPNSQLNLSTFHNVVHFTNENNIAGDITMEVPVLDAVKVSEIDKLKKELEEIKSSILALR